MIEMQEPILGLGRTTTMELARGILNESIREWSQSRRDTVKGFKIDAEQRAAEARLRRKEMNRSSGRGVVIDTTA